MFSWLNSILGGSSPVTGYLGTAIMILTLANQTLIENGIPHDAQGWIKFVSAFLGGLALRFAKDANVSNAPVPGDAKPVA